MDKITDKPKWDWERNQVIKTAQSLVEKNLVTRTWGNVSMRVNQDYMVITPSGKDYSKLETSDIIKVNIFDLSYDNQGEKGLEPSSEMAVHAGIYRARPAINGVIHTHQENLSALGVKSGPVNMVRDNGSIEQLNCLSYGYPGTKELGDRVEGFFRKSKDKALILQFHGIICVGVDLLEPVDLAMDLEKIAGNHICKTLGISGFEQVAKAAQGQGYIDNPRFMFSEDYCQIWDKNLVDEGESSLIENLRRKNMKAFLMARKLDVKKAIPEADVKSMRNHYVESYGKLKD